MPLILNPDKADNIACALESCRKPLLQKPGFIPTLKWLNKKGDIMVVHFCSAEHRQEFKKAHFTLAERMDPFKVVEGVMYWELPNWRIGGTDIGREAPPGSLLTLEQRKKVIIVEK